MVKILETRILEICKLESGKLEETIHTGLDSIVENLHNDDKLDETLHDGFHSIASKLEDNSNVENTLNSGLSDISQKLDQVTNFGLSGIINSLEKAKHPTINVPSSLGTSCK